jgi:type I restriction enzyme S subunit
LNQNENKYFVFNLLQTSKIKLHFDKELTGSTIKNLSLTTIKNTKAYFPTLPEQTKIANFLTAVDDKITLLTKKADLLSQYKKGVMQQIFSQELRFKDDDGQEFPEWEEKSLGDVAEINPKTDFLPEEFIYIDLESVEKGILLKETRIRSDDAPSRAQRFLKKEDILFQMVRPYQGNNLFFDITGDYVASTGYAQIRTMENPRFLYQSLHLENFTAEVMNRCTGTSYPAINSSGLALILITIPSLPEQTKIANFLTAIDEKITNNQTQLDAVKQYKQGLLQQMFV